MIPRHIVRTTPPIKWGGTCQIRVSAVTINGMERVRIERWHRVGNSWCPDVLPLEMPAGAARQLADAIREAAGRYPRRKGVEVPA